MDKIETNLRYGQLATLSGDALEFLERKSLTLAEIITVLDSSAGIARSKLSNQVSFAGMTQAMINILNGTG